MSTITIAGLVRAIMERPARTGDIHVAAVDGPTGGGKSTVAAAMADGAADTGLLAHVLRVDDLLDGWDDLEGAGRRVRRDVLEPLARGRTASYRAYDWHRRRFSTEPRRIGRTDVLVLDGVGSARCGNRPYLSFIVYVDAPAGLRRRRVLARDGVEVAAPLDRWMRAEAAHFAAHGTRAAGDVIVDGASGMRVEDGTRYVRLGPPSRARGD